MIRGRREAAAPTRVAREAAAPGTARAGTATLVDELFSPRILAALERVRLRASHASGERPGHTRVRGRSDASGSELDRHVPYTPGDDLRRVDWNVYARLGELLTRRFVAEREVPVWLLVDASASMGPAGPGSKIDMAAAIAGLFATVSLAGGDRVYVGTVPGRSARAVRSAGTAPGAPASDGAALPDRGAAGARPLQPRADVDRIGPLRGRQRLGELHRFLSGVAPLPAIADLAGGLDTALRDVRRGLVVLVSDFLVERTAIERALDVIRTRRCEAKIVQVLSRQDLDPSWLVGRDVLIDAETGEPFPIHATPELLHRYEAAVAEHVATVAAAAAGRAMTSSVTVSDVGLRAFLREELPRLGLRLVR